MAIDTEYYARKKLEPPFLRLLAPVLAADELANGLPNNPRVWVRQQERYRDRPDKLEDWLKRKRQEGAEAVVQEAVFQRNYASRKIRRTLHPDCAIERAFAGGDCGPAPAPDHHPDVGTGNKPKGKRKRQKNDDDDDDDDDQILRPGDRGDPDLGDARKRIQDQLEEMLLVAQGHVIQQTGVPEGEGSSAPKSKPGRPKRKRKRQKNLHSFFASKPTGEVN